MTLSPTTPQFSCNFKRASLILAYLFASNFLFSQSQQVYLFGNLADVEDKAAFFQKLEKLFQKEKEPLTLIVNGDLVNEKITGSGQEQQMKPLFQLADLMAKFENGQLIMVPGDREWNSGKKGGEKSLKNIEERFIEYYESVSEPELRVTSIGTPSTTISEPGILQILRQQPRL